jgi:RNA polymerase-binding transcription factor DksA
MAAKKNTPKKAAPKGKAKPAAKPIKKAVSKKPTAASNKTVAAKKVAKKAVPAKATKTAPTKKPAKAKKAVPVKKPAATKKTAPAKKPVAAKKTVVKKVAKPVVKVTAKTTPVVKSPTKQAVNPVKKPAQVVEIAVAPVAPHSDSFVQKQRQRLLDLRDELVDSMSGMTRDTIRNAPEGSEASGSGQHQGDAGSDAYDRDFALSVLAKEQDALYEIEEALMRIRKGVYGICELSNRKIPQARLEAIPFARLTVECQAQWEKEYGKRRFRPSNEVGFSGGKYADDEDSESVSLDEEED